MQTLGVESSFLNWGKSDLVFNGFKINASPFIFLIPPFTVCAVLHVLIALALCSVVELKYFWTFGGEGVDEVGEGVDRHVPSAVPVNSAFVTDEFAFSASKLFSKLT